MTSHARSETTQRHRERAVERGLRPEAFRRLGRTGLEVSRVGFGGYRIADGIEEHERALRRALEAGVNLIDTSTNYADGASERLVGRVLGDEAVERDEIVVVSKAGYVQGTNLERARARIEEGRAWPDMVEFSEGCWHCLHPDFLDEQLAGSLERLQLDRLDVYLLHNPEYFLADARRRRPEEPVEELRARFDERLLRAFAALERAAEDGRLSWYGVSSNNFGGAPGAAETTSITRMHELALEAARQLGRDESRLAVVQMPFNLLEGGPALHRGGEGEAEDTALDAAARLGAGVLVNRPLNAFAGGRLVRLADFAPASGPAPEEAAEKVVQLEDRFRETIAPALESLPGAGSASGLFIWGHELPEAAGRFAGVEHWRQAAEQMILPRLHHALQHVELHVTGGARVEWESWREDYPPAIGALLEAIDARYREAARERNVGLVAALDPLLPEELRGESLSRKALAVAAGARGVTCVLDGMRRDEYVDDAVGLLQLPVPETNDELLGRFAAALTAG